MKKAKNTKVGKAGKHYWFYLHPYVHLNIKRKKAVIYNTLNGALLEYGVHNPFMKILRRIDIAGNLYVTKLREFELIPPVQKAVRNIRKSFSGDLYPAGLTETKPIQLKPHLRLDKNRDDLLADSKLNLLEGDDVSEYLNEINLYVNNQCGQTCTICNSAYRQMPFCVSAKRGEEELDFKRIQALVSEAEVTAMSQLNVLGGDILGYSRFTDLIDFLGAKEFLKSYYIHYLNCRDMVDLERLLGNGKRNSLHILIHFPIKTDILEQVLRQSSKTTIQTVFHFTLSSVVESELIEDFVSRYNIRNVEIHPYYNGKNMDFFRSYVFTTLESIVEAGPTMTEIFSNRVINPNDFKRLLILPDSSVYANFNHSRIGSIKESGIFPLIRREMSKGNSWSRVRKNISPCRSCPYNALCPPISNYEYALKQYNLCDIWK